MRVLVIGAHGQVGRRLLPLLVENGHHVRGMIRDPDQAATVEGHGATPVIGDLEGAFARHLKGCDAVVFTAGSGGGTGADKTALVDGLGAILAVNAARDEGARRFLMVSARGADDPGRSEPLKHYLVAKLIADAYLERSGLDYTILRPGRLTDDEPTGRIRVGRSLGSGSITRNDVAATVATALETEATVGSTFELLNGDTPIPEALEAV